MNIKTIPSPHTQFSSIWPIDSEPGSDANESVLHIPQSSSITGILPSDFLVSYPGTWFLRGMFSLSRGVGVFYSPSRLGKQLIRTDYFKFRVLLALAYCWGVRTRKKYIYRGWYAIKQRNQKNIDIYIYIF